MTDEQIDALTGDELDRVVATELGWSWWHLTDEDHPSGESYFTCGKPWNINGYTFREGKTETVSVDAYCTVPDYSSSLDAAMTLADEWRKDGCWLSLIQTERGYDALLFYGKILGNNHCGSDPIPAVAVCRAFLKAKNATK